MNSFQKILKLKKIDQKKSIMQKTKQKTQIQLINAQDFQN